MTQIWYLLKKIDGKAVCLSEKRLFVKKVNSWTTLIVYIRVHGSGGLGFFLTHNRPVQDQVGGFLICNRPVTVTGLLVWVAGEWLSVSGETDNHQNLLKRGEISSDLARSCQIYPRSGEILLDLARFLPNRAEKSLVWPDPVFLCQKMTDLSEKVAGNMEKMAGVNGLWPGRVSWVLEEKIRNQPAGIWFLMSGPESDRRSCGLGGSGLDLGRLGGSAVDLDSPSIHYCIMITVNLWGEREREIQLIGFICSSLFCI